MTSISNNNGFPNERMKVGQEKVEQTHFLEDGAPESSKLDYFRENTGKSNIISEKTVKNETPQTKRFFDEQKQYEKEIKELKQKQADARENGETSDAREDWLSIYDKGKKEQAQPEENTKTSIFSQITKFFGAGNPKTEVIGSSDLFFSRRDESESRHSELLTSSESDDSKGDPLVSIGDFEILMPTDFALEDISAGSSPEATESSELSSTSESEWKRTWNAVLLAAPKFETEESSYHSADSSDSDQYKSAHDSPDLSCGSVEIHDVFDDSSLSSSVVIRDENYIHFEQAAKVLEAKQNVIEQLKDGAHRTIHDQQWYTDAEALFDKILDEAIEKPKAEFYELDQARTDKFAQKANQFKLKKLESQLENVKETLESNRAFKSGMAVEIENVKEELSQINDEIEKEEVVFENTQKYLKSVIPALQSGLDNAIEKVDSSLKDIQAQRAELKAKATEAEARKQMIRKVIIVAAVVLAVLAITGLLIAIHTVPAMNPMISGLNFTVAQVIEYFVLPVLGGALLIGGAVKLHQHLDYGKGLETAFDAYGKKV